MSRVVDPEGAHLDALRRLADFGSQRVIELGCGDGRLTVPVARDATYVVAFDPDKEAVERARLSLPAGLGRRVEYRVASGTEIKVERGSFDLALFSWSLWWVEPEDVVNVLGNMVAAVRPGGLVLDLQVIRPDPVVKSGEDRICEIWGEPIFAAADAAAAAVDATIESGILAQEAVDDHQVRTHFPTGPDLVDDFAGKKRRIPEEAVPTLLATAGPVTMRERCRLRRLRVSP